MCTPPLQASSAEEVAYVALLAGCQVQAGPVIKGRQLALVYSLGWPGPGPAPQLLAGSAASALHCAVLEWEARLAAGQCRAIRMAFELGGWLVAGALEGRCLAAGCRHECIRAVAPGPACMWMATIYSCLPVTALTATYT